MRQVGAGQQQHEFFAAIPRQQLASAPHAGRQHVGDPAQAFVAGHMAVMVVVALEMVDVHQQQAQAVAGTGGALPFGHQGLVEFAPVGNAGEPIGRGLPRQVFVRLREQLFLADEIGDLGAGDHRETLGCSHLVGMDPAVVGVFLQDRLGAFGAAGQALRDPLLGVGDLSGQQTQRHFAAQHRLQGVTGLARSEHAGEHLSQVPVADHLVVLRVVDGDADGQRVERTDQQFVGPGGVLLRLLHRGFMREGATRRQLCAVELPLVVQRTSPDQEKRPGHQADTRQADAQGQTWRGRCRTRDVPPCGQRACQPHQYRHQCGKGYRGRTWGGHGVVVSAVQTVGLTAIVAVRFQNALDFDHVYRPLWGGS